MVPVNFWAVLVSTIVAMVLGYLWYGPLFGKKWVESIGWSPERLQEEMRQGSAWSYLWMLVSAFVMVFVLAHIVIFAGTYLQFEGALAGAVFGFGCWLGFIATSSLGAVLWERKPMSWWYITNGYYLVTLVVAGMILAVWM